MPGTTQVLATVRLVPELDKGTYEWGDEMVFKVFLSHSCKDAEWVKWIAANARQVGIEIYLYEHDPQPGGLVADKVQANIRSSDALVVLLTKESQFSPYVQQEIGVAKGLNKPIIPLVQPDVNERSLAMLQGVEHIGFDFENPQPGLSALLDYLRKAQLDKEASQALLAVGALVETASRAKLTSFEFEILSNVPDDGRIYRTPFQSGEFLLLGGSSLPDPNRYDAALAAHYLDALESLQRRGLVRFEGGELYSLTGRGFDVRKILLQERAAKQA